MEIEGVDWLERPMRRFDLTLRRQEPGEAAVEAATYDWHGSATDEAHAVTLAFAESAADGWADTTSYRVCENVAFLPVATEFGIRTA